MKLRRSLSLLIVLLFGIHAELWASPTLDQTISANEPPFTDPESITEFNRLATNAVDEGSVQVLVVLKEDLDNDGLTEAKEQQATQETRIETEQNAVLKDIPIRRSKSIKRYRHLPLLALSANESELQRLRRSPHVAQIIRDKINFPASLDFSIQQIGADVAQSSGYTGAGQTIAILDNGVDKRQSLLRNKVVSEACFSTRNPERNATPTCRDGRTKDLSRGSANIKCKFQDFACTHGTIIAEIAAGKSASPSLAGSGVAPEAKLIAIKADTLIKNNKICAPESSCNVFFDSDILRGLDFVYRKRLSFNIASVNASLGSDATGKECRTSPIRRTVAKLRAVNIATIAASGNEGLKNRISSPACITGVISVGTTDAADTVASYSNTASTLTLLAPGDSIGFSIPRVVSPGYEIVASGTSLSAAFVSGAWATLKSQRPPATVDEILETLISTGVPITDPKNINVIKPRMRLDKALGLVP